MGKKFKIPLEVGFAALCEHIKAIRTTAVQSGTAVADLAESTAASLEEIDGLLGSKQDKDATGKVTIQTSGWVSSTVGVYKYYYDIAANGVTANDRADVAIAPASMATAKTCGFCPTTETLAGKIRLRVVTKPTSAITAEYWLHKA